MLASSVSCSFSMSLDEAIQLAFQHDAQRQADIFGAEARNADGWQAVAGYGPSLSVSGSYMRSRDSSLPGKSAAIEERTAHFEESEITVAFMQPLVDLEKASVALQGIQEMKISDFLRKKANDNLVLKVHERYYAVLSGQENLRLAKAESSALLKQVRHAEEKLELGFGTITDQYDAEARYRLSLAFEIAKKTELENARKALEEVIAQSVDTLEDLDPNQPPPLLSLDEQEWLGLARSNNTDLSLKRCRFETAKLHYRAVQSRYLPRLAAFADYSSRDSDDGFLGYGEERSEFDAGLRLEMNILAGGADTAAVAAASRRVKEARQQVTASNRSLERSVSSLWDSIHDTAALITAYHLAVEASRRAMDSTQAAYDEGVKVLLDVLNAQQDYYRALGKYRTANYDYMVLLERFRQVVGVTRVEYENM